MKSGFLKTLFVILFALILTEFIPQPSYAIWQALLNEHFEEDQRNPILAWPWYTDQRGGNRRRWHWNPRPPHRLTEGNATDYCWGLQDFIYNRFVVRNDDQSMWCAYTDRSNVNNPRWPEDDDYMNNQNAWMWWGPVDLSEASAAAVSFWVLVDLDNYARDSLSVVAVNNPDFLTLDGNDFRSTAGIGYTFSRGNDDWMFRQFSLDTLIQDGDTVSFIGSEEVYLAFVWQSDNRNIAGKGAFIDDVIFSFDDGLFDIFPVRQQFGYPVEEDSIFWTNTAPRFGDEVYSRLLWDVEGIGETPEFTVNFSINDELVFSDVVVGDGDMHGSHILTADTLWYVPEGEHYFFWELDVNNDVEETHEQNNTSEREFTATWNPPPMFQLTSPVDEPQQVRVDEMVELSWTISDSNEFDEYFSIFLYITTDTTGYAEDHESVYNYLQIANVYEVPTGEGSISWDLEQYYNADLIEYEQIYFVAGFAVDSDPVNVVFDIAPGKLEVIPPNAVKGDGVIPQEYALSTPYPNPFNSQMTIEYSLPIASDITLSVFDLNGREVETLVTGNVLQGSHRVNWNPENLSAGVYLVQFRAEDKTFNRKAVYMP